MSGQTDLIDDVSVKVQATELSRELHRSLVSVEVDDSLHLPDMFVLRIRDPELAVVERDIFALGKPVEISMRGDATAAKLMNGEITAIGLEAVQDGELILVVRGYDRSHHLHRHRRTRTFVQKKDSDIARRVSAEAGLRVQVSETRQVHQYVLQHNQTDWEFLWERARRIGYRVLVEDDVLHFEPPPDNPPEALTLEWGENLAEFYPELTTAEQVEEVIVRGWDPQTKRAVIGQATRPQSALSGGADGTGADAASHAFGSAGRQVIVDRIVSSQDEANALAQAICDELGGAYVQAEGKCKGDPRVAAGAMVRVTGLGRRFSRPYLVTHAVHRYDGTYTTSFTVSGVRSQTLADLLASAKNTMSANGSGVFVGIVTNVRDPEDRGRVKVRFPTLGDQESDWIRVVAPTAGPERGFLFLPEVDDEVLVAFEHGQMDRPYVVGSVWNGRDRPPRGSGEVIGSTGRVNQRIIRSRTGHTLTFDDSDEQPSITISDKNGNAIKLESQRNRLSVVANADLVLEGQTSVTVKGAKIDIEASGPLSASGATAEVQAQGTLDLKASGVTTIQGGMVKIN